MNPTAVSDLSIPGDAWLLALGTVLVLALVGRLWHRWQQGRSQDRALSAPSLPFEPPLSRWPGTTPVEPDLQRLVGEVQDRLGMQLLNARTLARTGEALPGSTRLMHLDHQLAQALLSLRLMRDALRPEPASLLDSLHGMQAHFQPLLAERGIRLDWQVDEALDRISLPARSRLGLLRLMQEALDNVVRHAREARLAQFRLEADGEAGERRLRLRVVDDGQGTPESRRVESTAQGIARMERQTLELGGRLAVGPARPGWCVDLRMPLD